MKFLPFLLTLSFTSLGQQVTSFEYNSIKERLLFIHKVDQQLRSEALEIEKKYGDQSSEYQLFWSKIAIQDSLHMVEVENIIHKYGWIGYKDVGRSANQTLFMIIQHSTLSVQQKYLPVMRKAVKDKKALAADLAFLEDRVAIDSGFEQIYGTQVSLDTVTGALYINPIIDPDHVNIRRAKAGLNSIEDYSRMWGIKWDLREHKKRIQDFKKTQIN